MPRANFETGTKVCSRCKIEKPIEQFCTKKANKDGLNSWCKNCCNNQGNIYSENNKDKIKQYYEINKDKIKQYNKAWREDNKDHMKQCQKAWMENNQDKMKQYTRNKYEKYKKSGLCTQCGSQLMINSNTLCEKCWFKSCSNNNLGSRKHWEHLKTLFEEQNHKCAYTGLDLILGVNASIDHIKPISRYPELAKNLKNVCWCDSLTNKSKNDRDLSEFENELNELVFYDRKRCNTQ